MDCYYCDNEITDINRTKEHIILAALGGSLTSNTILCRVCNSILGSEIDKELFSQLEFAAVYMGFSNNPLKMQTIDGEEIVVGSSFMPYSRGTIYIPNSTEQKFVWKKSANETAKILENNRDSIKKKYPGISLRINEYEEINRHKTFYLIQKNAKIPGTISFGGDEYFKAIVKMSVGFAKHNGISNKYLIEAIETIKGNAKVPADFFYPTTYNLRNKPNNEISHLLYLKGDPDTKILYVYSELFSFSNHICILSTNYQGEPIETMYHFDLVQKKPIIDTQINIKLNKGFTEDSKIILKSMFKNNEKEQSYSFQNIMKLFENMQLTTLKN